MKASLAVSLNFCPKTGMSPDAHNRHKKSDELAAFQARLHEAKQKLDSRVHMRVFCIFHYQRLSQHKVDLILHLFIWQMLFSFFKDGL